MCVSIVDGNWHHPTHILTLLASSNNKLTSIQFYKSHDFNYQYTNTLNSNRLEIMKKGTFELLEFQQFCEKMTVHELCFVFTDQLSSGVFNTIYATLAHTLAVFEVYRCYGDYNVVDFENLLEKCKNLKYLCLTPNDIVNKPAVAYLKQLADSKGVEFTAELSECRFT